MKTSTENITLISLLIVELTLLIGLIALLANFVCTTDTSDWFAPSGKTTLEVQHNGTDQTINPQATKDDSQLQGSEL